MVVITTIFVTTNSVKWVDKSKYIEGNAKSQLMAKWKEQLKQKKSRVPKSGIRDFSVQTEHMTQGVIFLALIILTEV